MEDDAAEIPISEMGGGLQWLVRSTPCKRSSHPLTDTGSVFTRRIVSRKSYTTAPDNVPARYA